MIYYSYYQSVMCPRQFYRVRVTSPSSQSHLKFFRVESWLTRVESQELPSHLESLVCKLESMSSQVKFHIFLMSFLAVKWHQTRYNMMPDKLENGAQHVIKWHLIILKMVPNIVLTNWLHVIFYLSLNFACLFHSHSFPQV